MTNTLYLPELHEMLSEKNKADLEEFCTALHPARTAEFMEGLAAAEMWEVLGYAHGPLKVEIFGFIDDDIQVEIIEQTDRSEIAHFIDDLPPDDRVDLLKKVDQKIVDELMPLIQVDERRDILRLRSYPEHTAGAVMTSEFARLSENLPVGQALEAIGKQAEELETIYYLYVVDDEDHLLGLASARQLVSAMGKPDTRIEDLMERDIVTVNVLDDQEEVADKVARYDLLAIPVVDDERRMVGIVTHDDIIDVVREEAVEDAYRIAAVAPLEEGYIETPVMLLTWKRGIWLTILFFGAMLTAIALTKFESTFEMFPWLVLFIPLVISTGGNTGNQSATLVITALTSGNITLLDWWRVVKRELAMGLLLGGFLGLIGFFCTFSFAPTMLATIIVPVTILLVVVCGTLSGSVLPLLFHRLGLDPAMMSNAFVAGLIDVIGIIIYMNVAIAIASF